LTAHAGIVAAETADGIHAAGLVTGNSIDLIADLYLSQGTTKGDALGGVGNGAARPLQIDSGTLVEHRVTIRAVGDVAVREIAGDLRLVSAETAGHVYIKVDAGALIDADFTIEKDLRSHEQLLAGMWSDLQLTVDT